MRLLVRATTIRAPAGPEAPRVYAIGRDRDAGSGAYSVDLSLSAHGVDNDQGTAAWLNGSLDSAFGYDRDRGAAAYLPNGGVNYGRDNDRGLATALRLRPGTDNDRGRASPLFRARGADNDTGRATATSAAVPIAYAYSRYLAAERMNDPFIVTAGETLTNHVLRLNITDTWLKQSNLTGGRIRNANCYDLIFMTTADVPLDHEIEAYDGTAGRLDFALRAPSWKPATDQFIFIARYGADL
jgi:hypothetical protein